MAIGTSREAELANFHLVVGTRRRIAVRLLPFLFILYVANFLDRTSVSYAAIGMSRDLSFSDSVFGFGVGVFFIGYLALQIPGALLVERWSARKIISASMVLWGSLTALTALVHTPTQLYFARFFLGIAEGSFFPGVILYLSHWFIRKDRAKAASNYMAAVPLSLLIGSPIAGWIIGHHWLGLEGWRWLFFLEGMPAILLGIVAFFYLSDWPKDAAWLSAEQRTWITRELEAEKPVDRRAVTVMETLRSGKVLLLGAVAFLAYVPSYTAIFWLPTLLKRQTGASDLNVGLLLVIPFGASLLAMLINGWHSDKCLERRWHAACPVLAAALAALGLITLPQSLPMTLFLFSLLMVQTAFLPTFWAIPTEILSETAAAAAVGVMSCIANIAGFFGPMLFGYLHTTTGSLSSGYAMLMASGIASAILVLAIPGTRRSVPAGGLGRDDVRLRRSRSLCAMKTVRIGSGAGYSGDRIDPAVELARFGNLDYLVFECLAERTIALAHQSKSKGLSDGYDPLLEERMLAVLPACKRQGICIISNMGAANPVAAAKKTREIAERLGLPGIRIAAVQGDDVLDLLPPDARLLESGDSIQSLSGRILSANAYIGAEPIVEALRAGADVILTGRVADPSLFLAPLLHEFGWPTDDWNLMGQGTAIGHLLECAGQLTGGYFADPGYKDVSNLAHLGFPLAEVSEDGSAIFSKVEGSGGLLNRATCMEQLLYEIQDPTAYLTPDVTANFTEIEIEEVAPNQIKVSGGRGLPKPPTFKVSVGYRDCWVGEGQISYAGLGALARARLAQSILAERLQPYAFEEVRFDYIGVNSIHGDHLSLPHADPYEVRLRVACRAATSAIASMVPREVEALYTNGPSGGGGVTTTLKQTVAILSTLIPSGLVKTHISYEVS